MGRLVDPVIPNTAPYHCINCNPPGKGTRCPNRLSMNTLPTNQQLYILLTHRPSAVFPVPRRKQERQFRVSNTDRHSTQVAHCTARLCSHRLTVYTSHTSIGEKHTLSNENSGPPMSTKSWLSTAQPCTYSSGLSGKDSEDGSSNHRRQLRTKEGPHLN